MKRAWIEFSEHMRTTPLSPWMTPKGRGDDESADAAQNQPARPVPGRGYPLLKVEFNGFEFQFATLDEMELCIRTLGQKLLPSSSREAQARRMDVRQHWLNRMPDKTKPWRYREKAVKYLEKARQQFLKELACSA